MKKIGILFATVIMMLLLAFSASAATEGYYTYEVENGEAEIKEVDTSISGEVTIPDALGGYNITSIGDYAFVGCTSLTSITIPDGVTSIGDYAFANCESLTSVTILDGVTSIGNHAFENCYSLTSITIPDSITSIGDFAFFVCISLTNISIPDSVTSIGMHAFAYCTSLTSVTIPDSVTSIGMTTFCGCTGLTSITIPDSVTSIGLGAFMDCCSLTSITIPDSVTSTGEGAFYNCTGLTSITIPDSVTSIGEVAFYNCTSLASITIPDSVTSIGEDAFYNCDVLKDVYYTGSENQWNKINIGTGNEYLTGATIHYHKHSFGAVVTAPTCTERGYTTYTCECSESYIDDIKPATEHSYVEGVCKDCGESNIENCSCNCHKGGFSGFIWKILRIFYKLFGMNKTCSCGVSHY